MAETLTPREQRRLASQRLRSQPRSLLDYMMIPAMAGQPGTEVEVEGDPGFSGGIRGIGINYDTEPTLGGGFAPSVGRGQGPIDPELLKFYRKRFGRSTTSGQPAPRLPQAVDVPVAPTPVPVRNHLGPGDGKEADELDDDKDYGGVGELISYFKMARDDRDSTIKELKQDRERNKWLALTQAGLGMAASDKPSILQAFGEGGQLGVKQYLDSEKSYREQVSRANQDMNTGTAAGAQQLTAMAALAKARNPYTNLPEKAQLAEYIKSKYPGITDALAMTWASQPPAITINDMARGMVKDGLMSGQEALQKATEVYWGSIDAMQKQAGGKTPIKVVGGMSVPLRKGYIPKQ